MEPDRDLPSHSFRFIKLFGRTIYCRSEPDSEDVEAAMSKRLKVLDDDRISRLPDELLISLLSLMTTKQSVKTSILSKRWQHLWKSVPVLDFIEKDDIYAKNLSDIIPRVDTVLALHRSPQIVKFRLNIFYDDDDEDSSDVDGWLSYTLTKNVKVLDLALPPFLYLDVPLEANRYLLPDFVYDDGSSVETLSLECFQMLPHNKPVSWTSLKLLLLTRVQLSNLSIREIISGCPSIMKFSLCCCSGFDQIYIDSKSSLSELIIDGYVDSPALKEDTALEIQARGIRSIELSGSFGRIIRVIDLSAVVDAKLEFHLETYYENVIQVYPIILKKLLKKLRHVGNLTIGTWCTQVLSVIAAKALPSLQSKYKSLTLRTCLRKLDLPGISSLLKSSADLQTLVVDIACNCYTLFGEAALDCEFLDSYDIEGKNYWSSMGTPACLTMSVTNITIIGFKGERLEIEFLQFLLENARVLQKISIHTFKNTTGYRTQRQASKLEGAFAQLLSFPRSSINAVILFS